MVSVLLTWLKYLLFQFFHILFIDETVLPSRVKQSLVNELDKRLDLDIDFILQSPKLRLQLSPAELDKKLLELYKNVADGPSGDVLRVIGGGNDVALQDLYVRRNKGRSKSRQLLLGPAGTKDTEDKQRTTSQWVNSVLKRNLPKSSLEDESENLKMCLHKGPNQPFSQVSSCQTAFTSKICVGRTRVSKFCLLI